MTASERRGRELAAYLDIKNTERRAIQEAMFKEALAQADPEAPALVLHSDTWHPGVMGIVASKVLERFYKPVFIIAQGKGSVRSTPGISAVEGLAYARTHLKRFGGHSQAAGFSLDSAAIAPFRARIFDYVRQFPTPQPRLMIDALFSRDELNDELFQAIKGLEPYGQGHPPPLFVLTEPLEGTRAVGEGGKHLQLRLAGLRGVAWQQGDNASTLTPGAPVNAAFTLHENHWQERRSLEFIAAAVRPAQPLGGASSERPLRYRRGEPNDPGAITTLPLNDAEPLALTVPLRALARRPEVIFALDDAELARLIRLAGQYPGVHDLRRAFVALSRRDAPPFNGVKAELCRRCLRELDLIDGYGRARNLKRDPYRSEALVAGLIERYVLQSFISAYRHTDDAAFDEAVRRLLGMTY
jgi:single-stranded-DNA-specific exonuclease